MANRPYINMSVFDLANLADERNPMPDILQGILAELSHRDSKAARALEQRIKGVNAGSDKKSADRKGEQKKKNQSTTTEYESMKRQLFEIKQELERVRKAHFEEMARSRAREVELEMKMREQNFQNGASDGLYGRVYLLPTAPLWLIRDVQRAFRVKYHPDKHEVTGKRAQAEKIFQEAEKIFGQILAMKPSA